MESNIFLEKFNVEIVSIIKMVAILSFFFLVHLVLHSVFKKFILQSKRAHKYIRLSFLQSFQSPMLVIIWIYAVSIMINILTPNFLPTNQLRTFFIAACLAWFCLRWKKNLQHLASKKEYPLDKVKIDLLGKLGSLAVILIATIFGLEALGFNMQTLATIGGISGFSLGFAGKDVISNFFGGFMLYVTRPFAVGDQISSSERKLDGVVEEIGWYYTCIRGNDKQPIYIPNSLFSSILITNLSRMSHWNIDEQISIRYKDIHVLEPIIEGIKQLLRANPAIDTTQPVRVYLDKFADSSLDIAIWACTFATQKDAVLPIRQELLLKIAHLVHTHGADFASPTIELIKPCTS